MVEKSGNVTGVEIRYFAEYDSPGAPLAEYVWLGRTVRYPGGLRGEVLTDGGFERDMAVLGDVSEIGGYTGIRELSESEAREVLTHHPVGADEIMAFEPSQAVTAQ